MNEKFTLSPNREPLDQMIQHGKGLLRLIAVAPELEGCSDLISYAVSRGLPFWQAPPNPRTHSMP